MPPVGLLITSAVMSAAAVCIGGLWAVNPKLFVRVWRKIAVGDYSIRSPEWEVMTRSLGGRLAGALVFCFGLGGFLHFGQNFSLHQIMNQSVGRNPGRNLSRFSVVFP